MEKKPLVTVGLPLYDMGSIAWLAVESLCNQKDAPPFELIIIEELKNCFGVKINQYKSRLTRAGCVRIVTRYLKNRITLGEKWYDIMRLMHPNSKVFILQAGDCYAHPYRLQYTYSAIVTNGYDYYDEQKGYFYDIKLKRVILFSGQGNSHPCNLNMAYNAELFRKVPCIKVPKSVDFYLFKAIQRQKGSVMTKYRLTEIPAGGVDTNGANKISARRHHFITPIPPFYKASLTIKDILPVSIFEKLLRM